MRIEELLLCAESLPGIELYREHRDYEGPIGKVLGAEITYHAEANTLRVEGEVEVFPGASEEEVRRLIEGGKGGFSQTMRDGGFQVGKKDGPPAIIEFDAYQTDEVQLYLKAVELSKELDMPVVCMRIRRHAEGIAVFVGGVILTWVAEKLLDAGWEKFKATVLGASKEGKDGKECRITVRAPDEKDDEQGKMSANKGEDVVFIVKGSDREIGAILDEPGFKDRLRNEATRLTSGGEGDRRTAYLVRKTDGGIEAVLMSTGGHGSAIDRRA